MRFFKSPAIYGLAAAVILSGAPATVRAADPGITFSEVLSGIDTWYRGVNSLTASFTQVVEVPALEKHDAFRGRLYFQKPDFLRLQYRVPRGQLLVADGKWYWFYMPQPDISQAMRSPMDQTRGNAPSYVLGGNMAERFDGELVGGEERGGAPCWVLNLEPKAPSPFYRALRAWVDRATFATRAVRYENESGDYNTFDFSDLKQNVEISPKEFVFEPPPGTQILDSE